VRARPLLTIVIALVAVLGIGLLAYRWEAPEHPAICQICQRVVSKQTAFHLDTSAGKIVACCPACAMHYILHHAGGVHQALATDFHSGRLIPAAQAYYDEGGDVQYCTAMQSPVDRGAEGVSTRVYDRCLPTLVAFKTPQEAEGYQQQHGGRVLNYQQALATMQEQ
jgi:hypothetical protein